MKILYAAGLGPTESSTYRLWALERLGHTVLPLNAHTYRPRHPLVHKIIHRLNAGPQVNRLNRDLLDLARTHRPDILWADKLLWMQPQTLHRLRDLGILTVSYMIDNPFGTRNDPGWRLYMKSIPHFDLHVTQRDQNLLDYRARGARDVLKIQTAYEPTIHFPPPPLWSDRDRNRDVSFIGTPYDNRASILRDLSRHGEFGVTISGNRRSWQRALDPTTFAALYREGELYGQQYREAIWRSRINLSFLTHANADEFVHKSFEIAGCGGFLLAERSPGHLARFVEDQEAVFFSTPDELLSKIRRYLPDEPTRNRIAQAGARRAKRDGYHNDAQVALILARAQHLLRSHPPNRSS